MSFHLLQIAALLVQIDAQEANSVVTSIAGGLCAQKRFLKESSRRVKIQNTCFEQNMLDEFKAYRDVEEKYLVLTQEAQGRETNQTKITRKITSEKVYPNYNWSCESSGG
ncbi:unnamed protein product [Thelazia callipaeda]|uniref:Secreted protein n=1 Tax=Thelazia callipaeda TaxID=103827 RepID=A0A0N5CU20_THECL|nr:unnamed protein product [Thelazia callipaeda]